MVRNTCRVTAPRSVVAAVLGVALAVAAPAAPALAHTGLRSTVPAAKSTTTKPVTEVTLTFGGLVKKPGTTVAVTGPDKASYNAGDLKVLDKTITQPVGALPVGTITVAWRTLAADGHPLEGSFTFTNRAAPASPSAEPTPTAEATPTTPPAAAPPTSQAAAPVADQASDEGSAAIWWILVVAVALVLALVGGLLWRRRRATG